MVMAVEDMSSPSPQCWDWSGCHQQTFRVEGKWGIIKVRLFKSCRANSDWLHSLNPPPPRSKTTMENQNERISSLRLKVRDKLFSKSGDLKIKCTAAIDTIYWRSNEESIQGLSERSYNLNIRDNGWNSGLYPEKVFLLQKKRMEQNFMFLYFQCRLRSLFEVPLRQCRSSRLSLAGLSSQQGTTFSSQQGSTFSSRQGSTSTEIYLTSDQWSCGVHHMKDHTTYLCASFVWLPKMKTHFFLSYIS